MGMMASCQRASRCHYSMYSVVGVLATRISVSAANAVRGSVCTAAILGRSCPLYPQKQTSLRATGMSALCHRATYASAAIDRDLLGQVLTNFCQQFARAVRLRHVVITSRCARYTFFPIQCM